MTYSDITKYFGTKLSDQDFQTFLKRMDCDLTKYNVAESEYISSKDGGLEIGFKNEDAIYDEDEQKVFVKGTPYLRSLICILMQAVSLIYSPLAFSSLIPGVW
jgi:hypothetical protein